MGAVATVTSKGQVTMPKVVRDALGVAEGDQILFRVQGNRAILRRTDDLVPARLIRHLTGEPAAVAGRATALLRDESELLLADLVVAETIYVLESFYERRVSRPQVPLRCSRRRPFHVAMPGSRGIAPRADVALAVSQRHNAQGQARRCSQPRSAPGLTVVD